MIPQYVIQASPLSKLFMPDWLHKCEADPDLVFKEVPFDVVIPRSSGSLRFTHLKPVPSHKVLPHQPNRLKDDYIADDPDGTIIWLTGGEDGQRSEETDIYGVVALNLDMDISAALSDVALMVETDGEKAKRVQKNYQDLQKDLVNQTKKAVEEAKILANERVKRAMRITHVNLVKQFEILKTEGKGVYTPSIAEAVGAHVLASEIEKSGEHRRKMFERMSQVMNQTNVLS